MILYAKVGHTKISASLSEEVQAISFKGALCSAIFIPRMRHEQELLVLVSFVPFLGSTGGE